MATYKVKTESEFEELTDKIREIAWGGPTGYQFMSWAREIISPLPVFRPLREYAKSNTEREDSLDDIDFDHEIDILLEGVAARLLSDFSIAEKLEALMTEAQDTAGQ